MRFTVPAAFFLTTVIKAEIMKEINVLSTFNGMGCLWYAFDRINVKVNKRYVSEIDKYANKSNDAAYPDSIHLGDVRTVDVSKLDKIDFFAGGSPCTDLSFAGTQSGLICNSLEEYMELRNEWLKTGNEDLYFHNGKFQESILFWEWLRILKDIQEINPDVLFFLENVRMTKQNERIINDALGLRPVIINSNLISAQNRLRYYWTNVRTKKEGLFEELVTDIPQPEDKGILLKDILQPEDEIDEKYYMSDKMMNYLTTRKDNFNNGKINVRNEEPKASCLTSSSSSIDISDNFIKVDKQGNKKADQTKAGCLTAGGNSGGNHSDMDIICVAMRGRNIVDGKLKDYSGAPTEQRLEANPDGKTNCLTSVSKDNLVIQINPSNESGGKQPFQHNRVYDINGICPTLNTDSRSPIVNPFKLRRLTPRECGRLQTFTDKELDLLLNAGISDTQLYKQFGNGWTVDGIAHILSFMK